MNKVIVCGRLVRDPDIRFSTGEKQLAIARYTIAVDRRGAKEKATDFINCTAFDRGAEFAEKYLKNGTKILITGHIQTGNYTGKDGNKVYTTTVVVEEHEFVESKAQEAPKQEPQDNGFMSCEDGGLPFN